MAIEELTAIIPPPTSPAATGTSEGWNPVEEWLGVELPPDFREYTAIYRAGMLAGWIGLYNPFTETAWGLHENVESEVDTIHMLERRHRAGNAAPHLAQETRHAAMRPRFRRRPAAVPN